MNKYSDDDYDYDYIKNKDDDKDNSADNGKDHEWYNGDGDCGDDDVNGNR